MYDILSLKQILESDQYELYCREDLLHPRQYTDITNLEEIASVIIRKYIIAFYHRMQNEWAKKTLDVEVVSETHPNINFRYTISVSNKNERIKSDVENLLTLRKSEIFGALDNPPIRNVYRDRHLYQPLLAAWTGEKELLTIQPLGINEGEEQFVKDLAEYLTSEKDRYSGYECFLLRNRARLGVGLFKNRLLLSGLHLLDGTGKPPAGSLFRPARTDTRFRQRPGETKPQQKHQKRIRTLHPEQVTREKHTNRNIP